MATTKRLHPQEDFEYEEGNEVRQKRIVIERRELIGEVQASANGSVPMVVAAFTLAGQYLNDHASRDPEPMSLEFEYEGVRFMASISGAD